VQRQVEMHALRRDLVADAAEQSTTLAARRETEDKLAAVLQAADLDLTLARESLDTAQRAHAAAGLTLTLHVGDACPVCRQQVAELPAHPAPADLSAAKAAVDAATAAQRQARAAHQDAARATATAAAARDSTQLRLDKAAAVMAETAAEAELTSQLAAIAVADATVASSRTVATARQHELAAAEKSRAALAAGEHQAWATLSSARDTLVPFGAPAVATGAGQDLAASWATLAGWATEQAAARAAALPKLEAAAVAADREFDASALALAELLTEHDVPADPLARAPAAVAAARVRAEGAVKRIGDDRNQAARLDQQIAAHREDGQVAALLGNLLRATSFERWLCSEALDSLVREASATLMELSGGQYELDRDDRNELVVIDYEDAGARRPVNTLSGGETFQASLALALALSRQVIGLSAGQRELNSMFLDEGFGTLDQDTLDTVASTLEKLAVNSDRMVGVITHVSELAERVPVRFVVERTGTTSTITRERV
jgi:exonuclease SbcC